MELYKEILIEILKKEEVVVSFPNFEADISLFDEVESVCYMGLKSIKAALEDDTMDNVLCSMKIKGIIRILEKMGVKLDSRHDF